MPLIFDAPALADQAQQGFWGGAHAGEEPMACGLARPLSGRGCGGYLDNPGATGPVRLDVIRSLLSQQLPGRVTPMPLLATACCERDVALPLELGADLAVGTHSGVETRRGAHANLIAHQQVSRDAASADS